MTKSYVSLLGSLVLVLSATPGIAGPCAAAIDQAQAKLDAQIDATAGKGPAGNEGTGARLHHQPTPGSIAGAEQKLGEGKSLEVALTALSRARDADKAGDKNACEAALADARKAMAP